MARKIDYLDEDTDLGTFYCGYLLRNMPCVFGKETTKSWKSIRDWVTQSGKPNFNFLSHHFGSGVSAVEYGSECSKAEMRFSTFLESVKSRKSEEEWLYLKDWHFFKCFPEYEAYETPGWFLSDWMNEFWDLKGDPEQSDYRFLYFGMRGSWTPFHADVLRSFSWSANICGRKLWYLVPPGKEALFSSSSGDFLPDIRERADSHEKAGVIKFIQNPGEIIFVPSNWHHQVHNLEDTISVNHNWFNAANVSRVWDYMTSRLRDVEAEISHCRHSLDNWEHQCQLILRAEVGMDFEEFFTLLQTIRNKREGIQTPAPECPSPHLSGILCSKHQDQTDEDVGLVESQGCEGCLSLMEKYIKSRCLCQWSTGGRPVLCLPCASFLRVYDVQMCKTMMRKAKIALNLTEAAIS